MGGDSARVQAQTPDADTPRYENMDSLLNEIVEQYEMGAFTASTASASAPVNNGGSVGVIFLTEAGEADDVRDFLLESGASPGPAFDSYVGADVPVSLLVSASQQEGVNWMQATHPAARGANGGTTRSSGRPWRGRVACRRTERRRCQGWRDLSRL